jgi:hypothetical protein
MFVYDSAPFGSDVLLCTFEESHVEGDQTLRVLQCTAMSDNHRLRLFSIAEGASLPQSMNGLLSVFREVLISLIRSRAGSM